MSMDVHVVHQVLSRDDVCQLHDEVMDLHTKHLDTLRRIDKKWNLLHSHGFVTFKMRGRARYDLSIPYDDHVILRRWDKICHTLLHQFYPSHSFSLIRTGAMINGPGSDDQTVHQDGPSRKLKAVNVFIPLVSLKDNPALGGTEFTNKDRTIKYTPLLDVGDVLLFDYRIWHRGLKNSTAHEYRPVLYMTYGVGTFRDTANFSQRIYRKMPALLPPAYTRAQRQARRDQRKTT
jgi:hypothetical protein